MSPKSSARREDLDCTSQKYNGKKKKGLLSGFIVNVRSRFARVDQNILESENRIKSEYLETTNGLRETIKAGEDRTGRDIERLADTMINIQEKLDKRLKIVEEESRLSEADRQAIEDFNADLVEGRNAAADRELAQRNLEETDKALERLREEIRQDVEDKRMRGSLEMKFAAFQNKLLGEKVVSNFGTDAESRLAKEEILGELESLDKIGNRQPIS